AASSTIRRSATASALGVTNPAEPAWAGIAASGDTTDPVVEPGRHDDRVVAGQQLVDREIRAEVGGERIRLDLARIVLRPQPGAQDAVESHPLGAGELLDAA